MQAKSVFVEVKVKRSWMERAMIGLKQGSVLSPGGEMECVVLSLTAFHVSAWVAAMIASAVALSQLSSLANANEAVKRATLLTVVAQACAVVLVLVHAAGVRRTDACASFATTLLFVTVATTDILSASALSSALSLGSQTAFSATVAASILNALASVMLLVNYIRWRSGPKIPTVAGVAVALPLTET